MRIGPTYLDSTALVKLVVVEPGSAALRRFLEGRDMASSALSVTYVTRAVGRADPRAAGVARGVLDAVKLVAIDRELLELAGRIDPPTLRSLDAIHLATAGMFGEELDSFVAYDSGLIDAAAAAGLTVESPS